MFQDLKCVVLSLKSIRNMQLIFAHTRFTLKYWPLTMPSIPTFACDAKVGKCLDFVVDYKIKDKRKKIRDKRLPVEIGRYSLLAGK